MGRGEGGTQGGGREGRGGGGLVTSCSSRSSTS